MNVIFYETDGIRKYCTAEMADIYKKEFDSAVVPVVIVVATDKAENAEFETQMKTIYNIDIGNVEKYPFIVVEANAENVNKHVYHTSIKQAKKILRGTSFKIVFFDREGQIVESKTNVMDKKTVLSLLVK